MEYTSSSGKYDAYVYQYRFGFENRCLLLKEADERSLQRNMDFITGSAIKSNGLYTFTTTFRSI